MFIIDRIFLNFCQPPPISIARFPFYLQMPVFLCRVLHRVTVKFLGICILCRHLTIRSMTLTTESFTSSFNSYSTHKPARHSTLFSVTKTRPNNNNKIHIPVSEFGFSVHNDSNFRQFTIRNLDWRFLHRVTIKNRARRINWWLRFMNGSRFHSITSSTGPLNRLFPTRSRVPHFVCYFCPLCNIIVSLTAIQLVWWL